MARFTQYGDAYVRDVETKNFIPTNQCTLEQLSVTRGLYIATLDCGSDESEVILRIDTVWTRRLYDSGYGRARNIVIDFESETCMPPGNVANTILPVNMLFAHVVAIQMGFDPVFYADGFPLFESPVSPEAHS